MISLLRSEVRRVTSRRLVRVLGALALLLVLVVQVRAFFVSDRNLAAARRRASVTQTIDLPPDRLEQICESMKAGDAIPPDTDCRSAEAAKLVSQQIQPGSRPFVDPRLLARKALPAGATAIAIGVAILAFIVGASYVGADWHAGTMQALLFWEPRRWRVLLAKATALVAVCMAFALAMQALTAATSYVTAATRGTTAGVTGGLLVSVLLTALRGLIVCSVTALLGFGIAGLARITGAALGVAFVYFVIVENLIRWRRPGWIRYLFSENVHAVMFKHSDIPKPFAGGDAGFNGGELLRPEDLYFRLGGVRGVVTLAIYLGLLLGAFYLTFTRRDVT